MIASSVFSDKGSYCLAVIVLIVALFFPFYAATIPQTESRQIEAEPSRFDAYVAPFFPSSNVALLDILIDHALGYKNFHEYGLHKDVSYKNLLTTLGVTLGEGALAIPIVNLLPEWYEKLQESLQEIFKTERDYLSKFADLATALSTVLAFHMHYDATFQHHAGQDQVQKVSYLALLVPIAVNAAEGLVFYSGFALIAFAVDKLLQAMDDFLPMKTLDAYAPYFMPNKESIVLDLVVCHALGHKNYDALHLGTQFSRSNLVKVVGMTLKNAVIVIPLLNILAEAEEALRTKIEEYVAIKRDSLVTYVDIATDVALGLSFHMRYENAFHDHAGHEHTHKVSYLKLLPIITLNLAEGILFYCGFYVIGLGLDRGLDSIKSLIDMPEENYSEL